VTTLRTLLAAGTMALVLVATACGGGGSEHASTPSTGALATTTIAAAASPWPAPPNPLQLAARAGLVPENRESLVFHVHAHLDVFIDGAPIVVPAGIGIDITDPGVRHGTFDGGPAYGGIRGCDKPCISPLHTHDITGVVHTESLDPTPNRLGQFFTEWGIRLDDSCVADHCKPQSNWTVYVDGQRETGNPADIPLTDHKEIAVVIGTPPATIPASFDFTGKA
jgi:hypothetical protein